MNLTLTIPESTDPPLTVTIPEGGVATSPVKTGTSPDPNVDVVADFDGQWYHRTDLFTGAWWQWVEQLDAWIPRFTDLGEPIAYNAFLDTYRKLTVVGADGAETITISAL